MSRSISCTLILHEFDPLIKATNYPIQPQVCLPLRVTALTMKNILSSAKISRAIIVTTRNYCDDNNPSPFSLCSFDRPDLLELQFSFWGPDRRRGFASERHGGQYRYPYAWHITYDLPQSGVETKNIASS